MSKKNLKLLIILTGCLMLAVLGVVAIPYGTNGTQSEMSSSEVQRQMSDAADRYMLAETARERAAASQEIASVRHGSRSVRPDTTQELLAVLRGVLLITIVGLSIKIITVVFPLKQKRKESMV